MSEHTDEERARGQETCTECGTPYPVWFAPNPTWNRLVPERVGMLCPMCFMRRDESVVWKVEPEGAPIHHEAVAAARAYREENCKYAASSHSRTSYSPTWTDELVAAYVAHENEGLRAERNKWRDRYVKLAHLATAARTITTYDHSGSVSTDMYDAEPLETSNIDTPRAETAEAELKRVRKVLREHEWRNLPFAREGRKPRVCSACLATEKNGHLPDCWLMALLGEGDSNAKD